MVHSIYGIRYSLYILKCTHFTVWTKPRTLYAVRFLLTIYDLQFYILKCTTCTTVRHTISLLHVVQCTMYSVQRSLYTVQWHSCIIYSIQQCTLYLTRSTIVKCKWNLFFISSYYYIAYLLYFIWTWLKICT